MENQNIIRENKLILEKEILENAGFYIGQKIRIISKNNKIEIIPIPKKPVESLFGFLKGIDTTIEREPDRI
jgi:hypothetical protein